MMLGDHGVLLCLQRMRPIWEFRNGRSMRGQWRSFDPKSEPEAPLFFAFFCSILLYLDALEFASLLIGCASSLILLNRTYMCFSSYFNRMCRKK